MVVEMENAYDEKVEEFRVWEEQNNLRKRDDTTKGVSKSNGAGVASSAPDFVDEVSRQMLEAYTDILRVSI